MYEEVNRLGVEAVKAAKASGRQWLAVEIYSALPVRKDKDLYALQSQVFVVTTLLTMQPPRNFDKPLLTALEALRKEISIASQSPRQR